MGHKRPLGCSFRSVHPVNVSKTPLDGRCRRGVRPVNQVVACRAPDVHIEEEEEEFSEAGWQATLPATGHQHTPTKRNYDRTSVKNIQQNKSLFCLHALRWRALLPLLILLHRTFAVGFFRLIQIPRPPDSPHLHRYPRYPRSNSHPMSPC